MFATLRRWFHLLSFLQYPLLVPAVFFCYRPFFNELEGLFQDLNAGLVFFGLAISFSTLQDTTKTHYKLAERLFRNPRISFGFLALLIVEIVVFIVAGLVGMMSTSDSALKEVSFGIIVFGLGLTGLLKSAVEMAEYQQRKAAAEAAATGG